MIAATIQRSQTLFFAAPKRFKSNWVFSKLCENGEDSTFKFRLAPNNLSTKVNVNYTTFWNNFSCYGLQEGTPEVGQIDSENNQIFRFFKDKTEYQKDELLFAHKDMFKEKLSPLIIFNEEKNRVGLQDKYTESITHQSSNEGNFYAVLPEHFNIDVETTGSISGINPADTKLVADSARLISHEGLVTTRRLRTNVCQLAGTGVEVFANMVAGSLKVDAGQHGFTVAKRLGV